MMSRMILVSGLAVLATGAFAGGLYDVFEPLRLVDGAPAYGDLRLGMTVEEAAKALDTELVTAEEAIDIGVKGLRTATVTYRGRDVKLSFAENDGPLALATIYVARTDHDSHVTWWRSTLLEHVKDALPGLTYLPSRHDPETEETDRDMPFYTIPGKPDVLVILEPGYSLEISKDWMWD